MDFPFSFYKNGHLIDLSSGASDSLSLLFSDYGASEL